MKIGIVGAGLAGLHAAHLLEKTGAQVELFEAKDRVGGRVHTIRSDSGWFEAGGEWIDADHHRMLSLANELGVPLVPTTEDEYSLLYSGQRCSRRETWPEARACQEALERQAFALAEILQEIPWQNTRHRELDQMSACEYMQPFFKTPEAKWLIEATYRSDEGEDLDRISALGWLCGLKHYINRERGVASAFRLASGGDMLVEAMASRVSASINRGKVLKSVEMLQDQVDLGFELTSERFDRVLLTVPPKAMLDIEFPQDVSKCQGESWNSCGMSRALKIAFEFSHSWWQDQGWSGYLLADSPLKQIWPAPESPILIAYICGTDSREVLKINDPIPRALRQLDRIMPGAKKHFIRGWICDWMGDPFAQGAFSNLAPGYVLSHMETIRKPCGRVHFAGEHTALWTGFMEGALESAERSVKEIIDAENSH